MITFLRRRLDRVRLFRSYATHAEKKNFMSVLSTLESLAADKKLKRKPAKYCTTFSRSLGEGFAATSFSFKLFPVKANSGVAIDFTPSKLTPDGWSLFREMLGTIFHNDPHQILSDFKLSKVEIAMDVMVPFDELLCIAPGVATENLNYLAKGTRYLGQKGGKRTFCIYDKRKQLADEVAVDLGHDLTRIEVRVRRSGISLSEIAVIDKPFGELVAVRKTALSRLIVAHPGDSVLQVFFDHVMAGGSAQGAYLQLSKHRRKHLLGRLVRCSLGLNGKSETWGAWIEQQSSQVVANFTDAKS